MVSIRQYRNNVKNEGSWTKRFGKLASSFGKSLLVPIALLPIAAILLRIGAAVPTTTGFSAFIGSVIQNAGDIVFGTLPILFAVGIAFGMAKDHRGEAAMAAFIGIAILSVFMAGSWFGGIDLVDKVYHGIKLPGQTVGGFHGIFGGKYNAILSQNVLNGIVVGSIVAWIYNRFSGIELPSALGFFSGRRLVPVLVIMSILFFAILWAIVFPWFGWVLYEISSALGKAQGNRYSNAGIMFAYGVLNRILLPFGMHHVPNTLFWFTLGEHVDAAGKIVNGDINIFLTGVAAGNKAGTFQSGFFPIMMFGLPALAASMIFNAEGREQKTRAFGILGGAAIISFFTGITEPIEFAFLFASPLLFGIHAVLTGIWGFITGLFGIQLGFGFSAGLVDYALSIPKSMDIIHANKTGLDAVMSNPVWLWAIGAAVAANYFFLSNYLIKKLNIATPGRKDNLLGEETTTTNVAHANGSIDPQAAKIVLGYGGWDNIKSFENCATRLRYDVVDASRVNESALKAAGVVGIKKISDHHVQAIVGPKADIINQRVIEAKGKDLSAFENARIRTETKTHSISASVASPIKGKVVSLSTLPDEAFAKKLLGDGVAVKFPNVKTASVFAPVSGQLVTAFPGGHAFGIRTNEGLEVLVHIGIDSVNLKGEGFTSKVRQNQEVVAGQELVEINLEKIKGKIPSTDVIVIVTSGQSITSKATGDINTKAVLFKTK